MTTASRQAVPGGLSYIEPNEEAEARELILTHFEKMTGKREIPRVCGYMIALKLFIRPEWVSKVKRNDGTEGKILLSDEARADDKYQSISGLVIATGPDAYRDPEKYPFGPWCKVGDWVVLPRQEGFFFHFNGVAMCILPDDRILSVISDPMSVKWNPSDKIVDTVME